MHVPCRRKPVIPADRTDRELFMALPLKDTWDDADLYSCFKYFWTSSSTHVPDSWLPTMVAFEAEFRSAVIGDPKLVAEYNAACSGS